MYSFFKCVSVLCNAKIILYNTVLVCKMCKKYEWILRKKVWFLKEKCEFWGESQNFCEQRGKKSELRKQVRFQAKKYLKKREEFGEKSQNFEEKIWGKSQVFKEKSKNVKSMN